MHFFYKNFFKYSFNFFKKSVLSFALISLSIFLLIPSSVIAAAGVPTILHHQGRLLDSSGNLLGGSGTNYCFRFGLYDNATAGSGTKLWPAGTPSIMTANVKNGVLNADIGDTTAGGDALDFDFNSTNEIYLSIFVSPSDGGDCSSTAYFNSHAEELTPRQRIVSAPYAINSKTVGGFTPSQSPTGSNIPVLTSGALNLAGAVNAGGLTLGTASAVTGAINLKNSTNANSVTIQSGVSSSSYTLTLPTDDGNASQFLQTDGTGGLSWVTIGGGGDALVANALSQFASTTSLQLKGVISDETGSGALVFATSPVFTTPNIGTATGDITGSAATVTGAAQPTITSVGTLTGLTVSGTTSINNNSSTSTTAIGTGTTSGAITIGGGSNTLAINTTSWDVSSGGAFSGLTGFVTTGDVTVSGANITGASPLSFDGSTADAIKTIFAIADPTSSSKTITFKDQTGTVALLSDITGTNSGTNTGDQNLFSSIPVSGQTTVTANSPTTALTLVAGSNITITTDNTAKSITITGSGTSGATTALDNLASVAINTALVPATAGALDFGSTAKPWADIYLAGTSGTPGTNQFKITGASTSGVRTITLPDASGTVALGTGTTNELSYWSNANTLGALSVATYPSLTELSYVKGVTSGIQSQLNSKVSSQWTTSGSNIYYNTGGVYIGDTGPSGASETFGIKNAVTTGSFLMAFFNGSGNGAYFAQSGSTANYSGYGAPLNSTIFAADYTGGGAYGPLVLATGGLSRFTVKADGKIGIGTTTPETNLQIGTNGLSVAWNTENGLWLASNTEGSTFRAGQDSTHSLYFSWAYNATPSSAAAYFGTYGYSNPIYVDGSAIALQGNNTSGKVQIGSTSIGASKFNVYSATGAIQRLETGTSTLDVDFVTTAGSGGIGINSDAVYIQALDNLSKGIVLWSDTAGTHELNYLPSGALKHTYNSTNYLTTSISSNGSVDYTITSSAGTPKFNFSRDIYGDVGLYLDTGNIAFTATGTGGGSSLTTTTTANNRTIEWSTKIAGVQDIRAGIYTTGFGIGTTAPGAALDVLKTTEQLRLSYDASNYLSTTIGSTGGVTFDAVGAGSAFTFSDAVTMSGGVTMSSFTTNGGLLYTNGSGVLAQTGAGTSTTILHGGTTPSYSAIAAADLGADILDFSEFKDAMTLDASTSIGFGAGALSFTFTNDGSGDEVHNLSSTGDFIIQDNGTPTASFLDTGAITFAPTSGTSITNTLAGAGTFTINSGVTTGTTTTSGLALNTSALTTGTGLYAAAGNSLTSGKLVDLQVSSTASLTNQTVLNIATAGTNATGAQTTYGLQVANTHTGTSTNVAGYFTASGGSNNYGLIVNAGDSGFGTTAPSALIHGLKTTEQLRLGYDASNYYSTTVGSTGGVTFNAVGAGSNFTFADSITGTNYVGTYLGLTGSRMYMSSNSGTATFFNLGGGDNTQYYRLVNAGSLNTAQFSLMLDGTSGTGNGGLMYSTQNLIWAAFSDNGSYIARASIATSNTSNAATNETSDLIFSAKGVGGSAMAEIMRLNSKVGINTGATISAMLHVVSTAEQQRIGYDASNYFSTTVASDGGTTFNTVGGGGFTFSDAVALGSNNLTMTGSIAATGARVTKGWFTDIESTNAPTVGGSAVYYTGGTDVIVADGGTGVSTLASNGILYGNGTGAIQALAVNAGATQCLTQASSGAPAWGTCGGSSSLSGLTVASATNTINNADYAQEWQWNTLSSNTGLKLSSTSTAAASNTQKLFEVALSGANATGTQTTYGAYLSNTHTGTASTNVGLYTTASGGTTNLGLNVDAGQTLMGGTTLTSGTLAKLNIVSSMSSNGSTTAIAGIHGEYSLSNGGNSSYVEVGNRFVINNAPTTNANTAVNTIIRAVDNTTLANTVRGIEVVANAGSNTAGTNTGIRTTGATFGIQAFSSGLAGGVALPAAIYAESTGTTQGDILRLYSTSMTSAPQMAYFYHDTSTFTGTGLLMDFAQSSGTFSGNFIDFQNNNTSLFKVTSAGVTSIGFSTSQASTSAVCSTLANATAPTASTLYELRDCGAAPAADYAEMYPVEEGIEFGDIVAVGSEMVKTYDITNGSIDWNKEKGDITKLVKSDKAYQSNVIGIVSDNYGDFSSTGNNIKEENNPMPVALSGRVPVKIASDSDPIYPGDYITTSNELGKGTKATKAGSVIGKALGFWTPESTSGTVMVYVEQGYYDGDSTVEKTFSGLTFFNADVQFMSKVTFGGEVEFKVPPMFNKDTAGFAVVKTGANKVDITFDTPYIATPIVNTSISFEEGDNVNEASAAQFFGEDIKFIVINKSKNGFTIILNKNASNDVHFSWTALQVKDAKIFESTIPGLTIEIPTSPSPSSNTENQNGDTVNNTDSNSTPNETVNDTTNNSGEPEIIIEEATGENTPAPAPTPEPEITVIETPSPEAPQVEAPSPEAPQTETQA